MVATWERTNFKTLARQPRRKRIPLTQGTEADIAALRRDAIELKPQAHSHPSDSGTAPPLALFSRLCQLMQADMQR